MDPLAEPGMRAADEMRFLAVQPKRMPSALSKASRVGCLTIVLLFWSLNAASNASFTASGTLTLTVLFALSLSNLLFTTHRQPQL